MMKKYPHYVNTWLQEHNKEGIYEISFINGGYYLYLKKQYGMKCHQYIGSIKEDGLHPSGRNSSSASPLPPKEAEPVIPSEMTVTEFGFSKAVFHLSPETWKNSIGRDWYSVLVGIIIMISPNSYLASEGTITARSHYSGAGRQLWEHLTGISLECLHELMGTIFLIRQDKRLYTSLISEEQASFCAKYEIRLEVV